MEPQFTMDSEPFVSNEVEEEADLKFARVSATEAADFAKWFVSKQNAGHELVIASSGASVGPLPVEIPDSFPTLQEHWAIFHTSIKAKYISPEQIPKDKLTPEEKATYVRLANENISVAVSDGSPGTTTPHQLKAMYVNTFTPYFRQFENQLGDKNPRVTEMENTAILRLSEQEKLLFDIVDQQTKLPLAQSKLMYFALVFVPLNDAFKRQLQTFVTLHTMSKDSPKTEVGRIAPTLSAGFFYAAATYKMQGASYSQFRVFSNPLVNSAMKVTDKALLSACCYPTKLAYPHDLSEFKKDGKLGFWIVQSVSGIIAALLEQDSTRPLDANIFDQVFASPVDIKKLPLKRQKGDKPDIVVQLDKAELSKVLASTVGLVFGKKREAKAEGKLAAAEIVSLKKEQLEEEKKREPPKKVVNSKQPVTITDSEEEEEGEEQRINTSSKKNKHSGSKRHHTSNKNDEGTKRLKKNSEQQQSEQ